MEEIAVPELSTNPQFLCGLGNCDKKFSTLEELTAHLREVNNHKSPPVPGDVGPKCQYCEHKEKYQSLADEYVNKHAKQGEKMTIPFVQELALILDKDRDIVNNWAKKSKDGELEHPEFAQTVKKLMNLQELRLLQRTLGRYNPTGAIFQLKTNHGYVETEKKVVAGDSTEPLIVEIVNERKIQDE